MNRFRQGTASVIVASVVVASMIVVLAGQIFASPYAEEGELSELVRHRLGPEQGEVVDRALAVARGGSDVSSAANLLAFAEALIEVDAEVAALLAGIATPSAGQLLLALEDLASRSVGDAMLPSHRIGASKSVLGAAVDRMGVVVGGFATVLAHTAPVPAADRSGATTRPVLFRLISSARPLGP